VLASDTICQAIRNRRVLSFVYKDGARAAEPYMLGYDASGTLMLSAVQISGGSGVGFRTFIVAHLSVITVTQQRFIGVHRDYNPRDRLFTQVLCQL
jgi:hypothetical protein